jgi:hypothetical protein
MPNSLWPFEWPLLFVQNITVDCSIAFATSRHSVLFVPLHEDSAVSWQSYKQHSLNAAMTTICTANMCHILCFLQAALKQAPSQRCMGSSAAARRSCAIRCVSRARYVHQPVQSVCRTCTNVSCKHITTVYVSMACTVDVLAAILQVV